jgi:hypothetical protein
MTERLLNHYIDNLSKDIHYDDNIKLLIKKFIIPKYIDIVPFSIYEEYRTIIPNRISTLSLPRILRNIVAYYGNDITVMNSSVYAVALTYLHLSGEDQGLHEYEIAYAKGRGGVIGFYYDNNNKYQSIVLKDIIFELLGDSWLN